VSVRYVETMCKSAIGKGLRFVDPWFWTKYSLNPYRGCEHACEYCDARTHKYLIHDSPEEFSTVIFVKVNAPEVLAEELARLKKRGARKGVIGMGGVTDAYQPAERKYRIARQILEVIKDYEWPFALGTKSDLVLRDLDLISEISKKTWCYVAFTITTLDKGLVKLLEPRASPPRRRLRAMRKISDAGIMTGVWMIPMVPYITDDEENIERVVKASAESGADFVLGGGGMTFRDNQKIRFTKLLQEHFPSLIPKYEELYGGDISPERWYTATVMKKFIAACKKHKVKHYIPPYIPEGATKNLQVAIILHQIAYFLQLRGENSFRIQAYRKAAQSLETLEEDIETIHQRGRLESIVGIGKGIAKIIAEFLTTGKCEYYESLKSTKTEGTRPISANLQGQRENREAEK